MGKKLNRMMERKVVTGWLLAPLILALVTLLFYYSRPEAAEWLPNNPYLFLGLDVEMHDKTPTCYSDAENPGAANLGIGATILGGDWWEINGQWTHHSCAFDRDFWVYDGIGIQARWYPWGKK